MTLVEVPLVVLLLFSTLKPAHLVRKAISALLTRFIPPAVRIAVSCAQETLKKLLKVCPEI